MKKTFFLLMTLFALSSVNMMADLPATNAQGYLFNKNSKLFWGGENGTIVTGDITGCLITIKNEGISENSGASIKGNQDTKEMPGHQFTYLRFYPDGTGNDYRLRYGDDGLHWGTKNLGYNKWACEETTDGIIICLIYKPGNGYPSDASDKQGFWLTSTGFGGQVTPVETITSDCYWEWIAYDASDNSAYDAKVLEALAANKAAIIAAAPTGAMATDVKTLLDNAVATFDADATLANYEALKSVFATAEASVKAVKAFDGALVSAKATAVTTDKINATILARLNTAITDYDGKTYATDDEYKTATDAVVAADNAAKANIQGYKDVKSALDEAATAAVDFTALSKKYYDENIATYVAAYENITITGDGSAEVAAIKDVVVKALAKDLKPGDDATSVIANPQFNEGISGWKGDFGAGKQKGDASNYVVTNYGKPSDIYQNIEGMKPGYYKLEVQAFTRLMTSDRTIADGGWDWHFLINGEELANYASIYANGVEKKVHSIVDKVYTEKGTGTWATIEGTSPELYVPYNANSSSDVFTRGDYDNYLYFEVAADGNLTLGVKNTDTSSSAYIAYDNFRLTYLGTELPAEDVTLEVTDAKYATFVAPFDVAITSEFEAYAVTAVESDGVTLKLDKLSETIPANTPVVLYAETPVSKTVSGINTATDLVCKSGLLTGVYCEKRIPVNTGYVLQEQAKGVKFYQTAESKTVPANHAYLFIPAESGSDVKAYGFEAIATAIQNIKVAEAAKTGAIYNLQGQQLATPQKGVNVINGKKIIIK